MKREIKYDILRIIACFAVVQAHVAQSYWGAVDVNGSEFTIMTVYDGISRFAVPVFFMLSGTFLLDPEKEMTAKRFGRQLWKLFAGFYLWSFFYAIQGPLYRGVTQGFENVSADMWKNAWTNFLMGHGHMWFMLDLFGFYLLLPMIRKVCEDRKATGYFLLLWVLIRYVLQILIAEFDMQRLLALTTNLHLYALTGYIGYFIAGYWLRKTVLEKKYRLLLYGMGVGAVFYTILKTLSLCRETMEHDVNFLMPGTLNILVYAAAVFVLFCNIQIPENCSERVQKWIATMAGGTFFVYMIHPFFIEKLQRVGIIVINYPVLLSVPIMTILIFAVGMLLAWIAGKIPVLGKIVNFR